MKQQGISHVTLLAGMAAAMLAIAARAAADETGEWPAYSRTPGNERFSPLKQITAENVSQLKPAWKFRTGYMSTNTSFECTPAVVDGVLYLTSPKSDVHALDAATGRELWKFDAGVAVEEMKLCCGIVNRGVAVAGGVVYLGALDARLVALDAKTGKPLEGFGEGGFARVAEPEQGYSLTSAPAVWDGKVFLGIAGGEFMTRGFFSAYDAKTGKLLWRWNTIPEPGEPGGDTWPPGEVRETGGVPAWMTPAIDPENRLVIFGTGNPNPDFDGGARPGDNLYSVCIVALDLDTGKLKWHFQQVKHDIWDYDQAAAPILFETTLGGKKTAAVGAAGKIGWFYILDRKTGAPLLPMKEIAVPQDARQQTAKTQTIPAIPPFVEQKNLFAPPTPEGVLISPAISGGSEWSPSAYSPETGLVYIAAIHKPMIYTLTEETNPLEAAGGMTLGGNIAIAEGTELRGDFIAIDANTGLVKWRTPTKPQPVGGMLATAGGVVFAGESNNNFSALDAATGKRLWQFDTGAGVNAGPMTYAVGGRQYVAVAAGGLALESLTSGVAGLKHFRRGDTLWVFALPEGK